MPTITTVDATWDTGITMDAAELRRADSAMFAGDGSPNGVRGGIVRHGDNSLAVAVNGSDQVTVQPGAFVIPAATGLGVYRGALQTVTSAVALSARNATNPRIDLIVIQVAGAGAVVKTIDGTPGSSPSAPALPAQHIELARVTVPATGGGAVTVDATWRAYAAALGGTLYVEQANRLPGSGNQKGQRAIALNTGVEHVWNGTIWRTDDAVAGALGANMTGSITTYRRDGVGIVVFDLTSTAAQSAAAAIAGMGAAGAPTTTIPGTVNNLTAGTIMFATIETGTGFLRLNGSLANGQQIVGSITVPM